MENENNKIVDHRGNKFEPQSSARREIAKRGKRYVLALIALLAALAGILSNYQTIKEILFSEENVSVALSVETVRDNASGGPRVSIAEENSIKYSNVAPEGEQKIFVPQMPFITQHGDITHFDDSRISVVEWELAFPFPALDIKVANNSKTVVFYSSARILIKSVVADDSPLVYEQWNGLGGMVNLYNIGWGPAVDARADLTVSPTDEDLKANPVIIRRPIGEIPSGKFTVIDLNQELCEKEGAIRLLGMRIPAPCDNKKKYGDVVKVVGGIYYTGAEAKKYQTELSFNRPLVSMPLGPVPPSYTYDVEFVFDEGPTEKSIDISQEIKAGSTDRFRIVILPDRSAIYKCELTLQTVSGETQILSFSIKMFRPRISIRNKKHNKAN
jgi:hypothetical protein